MQALKNIFINGAMILALLFGLTLSSTAATDFEEVKALAEKGEARHQGRLGMYYNEGTGVRQNKTIAKEWYGKSCDNGFQVSCDLYRILNEQGY